MSIFKADKAVTNAADRVSAIAQHFVPETSESIERASRKVGYASDAWQHAGEIAGRLFAVTAAVIILRFAWDVAKDLRGFGLDD